MTDKPTHCRKLKLSPGCACCPVESLRAENGEWTNWENAPADSSNTIPVSTVAALTHETPGWCGWHVSIELINIADHVGTSIRVGHQSLGFAAPSPDDGTLELVYTGGCGNKYKIDKDQSITIRFGSEWDQDGTERHDAIIVVTEKGGTLSMCGGGALVGVCGDDGNPQSFRVEIAPAGSDLDVGNIRYNATQENVSTCPPVQCNEDCEVECCGRICQLPDDAITRVEWFQGTAGDQRVAWQSGPSYHVVDQYGDINWCVWQFPVEFWDGGTGVGVLTLSAADGKVQSAGISGHSLYAIRPKSGGGYVPPTCVGVTEMEESTQTGYEFWGEVEIADNGNSFCVACCKGCWMTRGQWQSVNSLRVEYGDGTIVTQKPGAPIYDLGDSPCSGVQFEIDSPFGGTQWATLNRVDSDGQAKWEISYVYPVGYGVPLSEINSPCGSHTWSGLDPQSGQTFTASFNMDSSEICNPMNPGCGDQEVQEYTVEFSGAPDDPMDWNLDGSRFADVSNINRTLTFNLEGIDLRANPIYYDDEWVNPVDPPFPSEQSGRIRIDIECAVGIGPRMWIRYHNAPSLAESSEWQSEVIYDQNYRAEVVSYGAAPGLGVFYNQNVIVTVKKPQPPAAAGVGTLFRERHPGLFRAGSCCSDAIAVMNRWDPADDLTARIARVAGMIGRKTRRQPAEIAQLLHAHIRELRATRGV